jgi:molecular chaperone DnaK
MAAYGIDLGTTHSCIAYVDDSGRPVILKSVVGEDTTPSVVYFESPETVIVGREAKDAALLVPQLVVQQVKRNMGEDVHYTFYGQDHTPESISALILRELVRAAREQTGEEVRDVVITVPAYFGMREREATRKAAQIAGLDVLDLLAEPVAAALAYQALGESDGTRHLFVYDLGGGTFDTTVIRLDGENVQVVCTDGDARLGGADWDAKIRDFLLQGFTSQYPQLDPGDDEQFMQDVATSAEQLKKALSAVRARKFSVRFAGSVVQLELTREHLEELTSELLERTMEITSRTLATARGKGIDHFDDVLLVGGMTVMPVIAQTLKDRFGLEARQQDPHLAVAKGAALFALMRQIRAGILGDAESASAPDAVQEVAEQLGISAEQVTALAQSSVAAVVPRAFGLKVVDGNDPLLRTDPDKARTYIEHLFTPNTPLPADTGPRTFHTVADNQRKVVLEVWEQAGAVASEELEHNTLVGEVVLGDLPPRPAGAAFQVAFHMTETGLLQVHGREADSGREVHFEVQIGSLDESRLRQATAAVASYWLPEQSAPGVAGQDISRAGPAAGASAEPVGSEWPSSVAPDADGDVEPPGRAHNTAPPWSHAARADQRFFLAELEDRPILPLKKAEQYTIAFSVGLPSAGTVAAEPFPDEVLAAVDRGVEVFDLTVQLDSEDFQIFGERTRPLRVPRAGRSLGKARFDIAPLHNGRCRLVASVHYRGNFVHQLELAIPVGGPSEAPVEVSTRGRPPDSAAALEPRSISIVLEPAPNGGFSCTALGSVVGRTVLPVKDTELAAAVGSARAAMMRVIQSVYAGELVFQTGIDIPNEARDSALRMLARAGSRLFQQLFLHPAAGADARRIGEWLRDYSLDPGLRLTVQIVADRAPLPWAMLYLGDASEGAELDWNNFLGMRHIIEQLPLQTSLGTRDNQIVSEPSLAVSVNVNTSIDASMGITLVAEHQRYWTDTATARAGLKLVSRSTMSEVVSALADRSTSDQIVYFYCHATTGGHRIGSLDDAAIVMGTNDAVTLADLYIDAPTSVQLAGNPLVFVNACESAELSPLFYDGFVPYFMAKGARGVIGTECKIPVLFAIEWADAFFEQFLDGAAVGTTVLKLRRDFMREHNNPLGLIYAVHCDADTRIAPGLARVRKQ